MNRTSLFAAALVAVLGVFTAGFGLGVATRTLAGVVKLAALSALVVAGLYLVTRYLPPLG